MNRLADSCFSDRSEERKVASDENVELGVEATQTILTQGECDCSIEVQNDFRSCVDPVWGSKENEQVIKHCRISPVVGCLAPQG